MEGGGSPLTRRGAAFLVCIAHSQRQRVSWQPPRRRAFVVAIVVVITVAIVAIAAIESDLVVIRSQRQQSHKIQNRAKSDDHRASRTRSIAFTLKR